MLQKIDMEHIEADFKPHDKWTAQLVAPWGDKQWKVFRDKQVVGQIGWAIARTAEEAIDITRKTLEWQVKGHPAPTRRWVRKP